MLRLLLVLRQMLISKAQLMLITISLLLLMMTMTSKMMT